MDGAYQNIVVTRRRGRPPAALWEVTWCAYQRIVVAVHRQQLKYPTAKLDTEIVPRVAQYFGVSTRKVWRALKFHETMTNSREPVRISDDLIALQDEAVRRMGIRPLGR
jgi:hypothetical protein